MSECLKTSEVVGLWADTLSPSDKARCRLHLRDCPVCQQELRRLQHSSFRKTVRVTLWMVFIGVICGGPALTIALMQNLGNLLRQRAEAYTKAGVQVPWLTRLDPDVLGPAVVYIVSALGLLLMLSLGLFLVLKFRPRTFGGDASYGLATGLVAGVAMFAMVLGWVMILQLPTESAAADMNLLAASWESAAAEQPNPASHDELLKRYPDLKGKSKDRVKVLLSKIVADQLVQSVYAIWIGLAVALIGFAGVGIGQTMSAGYLMRRGDPLLQWVVPYFELSLAATFLAMALASFGLPFISMSAPSRILMPLALTALAITGIHLRWPWLVRATLYLTWFFVCIRLVNFNAFGFELPWWVDALVYPAAVAILVRHFMPRKHVASAGTAPTTVAPANTAPPPPAFHPPLEEPALAPQQPAISPHQPEFAPHPPAPAPVPETAFVAPHPAVEHVVPPPSPVADTFAPPPHEQPLPFMPPAVEEPPLPFMPPPEEQAPAASSGPETDWGNITGKKK